MCWKFGESSWVAIIKQVCDLDLSGQWVFCHAGDVVGVRLPIFVRQHFNCLAALQAEHADDYFPTRGGVFKDVVIQANCCGQNVWQQRISDTKEMPHVWLSSFIKLGIVSHVREHVCAMQKVEVCEGRIDGRGENWHRNAFSSGQAPESSSKLQYEPFIAHGSKMLACT